MNPYKNGLWLYTETETPTILYAFFTTQNPEPPL